MQNFTDIPSSRTLSDSLIEILNNDKTGISCNSGTTFPTTNLQIGMLCYRTDQLKLYQLIGTNPDNWRFIMDLSSGIDAQFAAKLNAASYTAADVLAKLLTVDGAGTGLDADLLDGQHASAFASSTVTRMTFSACFVSGRLLILAMFLPVLSFTASSTSFLNSKRSTLKLFNILTAVFSPSRIRPRSKCSVPMKSFPSRRASSLLKSARMGVNSAARSR